MIQKVACASGKGMKKTSKMRSKSIRNSKKNQSKNHVCLKLFLGPHFFQFLLIFFKNGWFWDPHSKSDGVKNGTEISQVVPQTTKKVVGWAPKPRSMFAKARPKPPIHYLSWFWHHFWSLNGDRPQRTIKKYRKPSEISTAKLHCFNLPFCKNASSCNKRMHATWRIRIIKRNEQILRPPGSDTFTLKGD